MQAMTPFRQILVKQLHFYARGLISAVLTSVIIAFIASSVPASGLTVTPPPPEKDESPLLVTGYSISSRGTEFVQLYNRSSKLVSLSDFTLTLTDTTSVLAEDNSSATPTSDVSLQLKGHIKPDAYIVVARPESVESADFSIPSANEIKLASEIITVQGSPDIAPEVVRTTPRDATFSWMSLSKTLAGNYTTTSKFNPAELGAQLFGGGLYTPRTNTLLRIVEIAAHPNSCSPVEVTAQCVRYVKVFNPSSQPYDMSNIRLRIGDSASVPSVTNAVNLFGVLAPGAYTVLTQRNDDKPLSISTSKGYVWLEDSYGLIQYASTVVSHESLSGNENAGRSWAYDMDQQTWRWAVASLSGPSQFIGFGAAGADEEAANPDGTSSLKPCNADQERNPATNRCRLIVSASSSLVPCAENQIRNSQTNRCRLIASLTSSNQLVACNANQERNPTTNRCRLIASAGSSSSDLKPCTAEQERNPETNRCRKITTTADSVPGADFAVTPTEAGRSIFTGWWLIGGIVALGAGYAAWEWRRELRTVGARVIHKFSRKSG